MENDQNISDLEIIGPKNEFQNYEANWRGEIPKGKYFQSVSQVLPDYDPEQLEIETVVKIDSAFEEIRKNVDDS